jgi:hypothetical protein
VGKLESELVDSLATVRGYDPAIDRTSA